MANPKEDLRRAIEAFNARDLTTFFGGYADDAELTWPGIGTVKGRQAITDFWKQQIAAFPDGKVTIKRIIGEGDTVAMEYEFSGTNTGPLRLPTGEIPATGKKVVGKALSIGTWENGKCKSHQEYFDQVEGLIQLGLMPVPAAASA